MSVKTEANLCTDCGWDLAIEENKYLDYIAEMVVT